MFEEKVLLVYYSVFFLSSTKVIIFSLISLAFNLFSTNQIRIVAFQSELYV